MEPAIKHEDEQAERIQRAFVRWECVLQEAHSRVQLLPDRSMIGDGNLWGSVFGNRK